MKVFVAQIRSEFEDRICIFNTEEAAIKQAQEYFQKNFAQCDWQTYYKQFFLDGVKEGIYRYDDR